MRQERLTVRHMTQRADDSAAMGFAAAGAVVDVRVADLAGGVASIVLGATGGVTATGDAGAAVRANGAAAVSTLPCCLGAGAGVAEARWSPLPPGLPGFGRASGPP